MVIWLTAVIKEAITLSQQMDSFFDMYILHELSSGYVASLELIYHPQY